MQSSTLPRPDHVSGSYPRLTMEQDLIQQRCTPYPESTSPLTAGETATYLSRISHEWRVVRGKKLRKRFHWRNFLRAVLFVNAVAYLAEQEDHHPDMTVSYNVVVVELSTHSIGGLSRNDFIMAAKIDQLASEASQG